MQLVHLGTEHGVYISLAVVAFISAVFPVVNAELAVVFAAALPNPNLPLLVAVATGAQMAGKSTMYWLGRRGVCLASGKYAHAMERWGSRFRGSPKQVGALLFLSSAAGLPPFYVIATLAGAFRTSFVAFILAGTAGRFLRFTAVGLFPFAVKSIAG